MLGIAWADIDAKYRALVPYAGLPGERVEASLAFIRGMREAPRAAALCELLQPPRGN
jgi:hypothetical protein